MDRKDVITILVTIVLGVSQLYLYFSMLSIQSALLNLQSESKRADISILLNPSHNQNWTIVSNGVYLTVNGTLSNEGTRTAIIKQMELSVVYNWPEHTAVMFTTSYENPAIFNNWRNDTLSENEKRPFSLTIFVSSSLVVDIYTQQKLSVGNSRSDMFRIIVKYDDGISEKTTERTFSAES